MKYYFKIETCPRALSVKQPFCKRPSYVLIGEKVNKFVFRFPLIKTNKQTKT